MRQPSGPTTFQATLLSGLEVGVRAVIVTACVLVVVMGLVFGSPDRGAERWDGVDAHSESIDTDSTAAVSVVDS